MQRLKDAIEIEPMGLTDAQIDDLVAFMALLTDEDATANQSLAEMDQPDQTPRLSAR